MTRKKILVDGITTIIKVEKVDYDFFKKEKINLSEFVRTNMHIYREKKMSTSEKLKIEIQEKEEILKHEEIELNQLKELLKSAESEERAEEEKKEKIIRLEKVREKLFSEKYYRKIRHSVLADRIFISNVKKECEFETVDQTIAYLVKGFKQMEVAESRINEFLSLN